VAASLRDATSDVVFFEEVLPELVRLAFGGTARHT
jgi:hypothetical protein